MPRRAKIVSNMHIINGFNHIPTITHAVATVGSYDGVHSGHKVLIEQVIAHAKARGGQSVVLTFEPHPRITLGRAEGLKLLSTVEEKALLLEQLGVDFMLIIPFTLEFSRLSHAEFIGQYLIDRVGIEELVIGYNHHFGHNKSGDYDYLATNFPTLKVTQVEQQRVENDKVSSTVIRTALSEGNIELADRLFGHPYIICGQSDSNGFCATSQYKLLPPKGDYQAVVNGKSDMITICDSGIYTSVKSNKITIEI
ncbi:MAG: FAD synthetase [Alistipes sp.]|nr:FAD synthetase [Alistipes sp.]